MITVKDVEKLAALGRIAVTEEEKQTLQKDISSILAYVEQIQKLTPPDSEKTVPMLRNVLREDGNPHESGVHTEKILNAAPKREGQYVGVKKIL